MGGIPKVDGTKKRPHWSCKLTNSGSEKHSLLILGQSVRDPPRLKDSNIKNLKSRISGWSRSVFFHISGNNRNFYTMLESFLGF